MLQGIIDANVMGGIAKYQEAFFTADFIRSCPQSSAHIHRLHGLIMEQVRLFIDIDIYYNILLIITFLSIILIRLNIYLF